MRERVVGAADGIPRCDCGAVLTPAVVLFGEMLPVAAFARAERLAAGADLMLCSPPSARRSPFGVQPRQAEA